VGIKRARLRSIWQGGSNQETPHFETKETKMKAPHTFSKILLKGLSLVLPVAVAIYVIAWLVRSAEGTIKGILTAVLPEGFYLPGMGLIVMLTIVFGAGLLMYPWITRKLIKTADNLFRKIPLFGSVYSPVKDLMDLLGGGMDRELGRPVMIRVPNTDMETLGFVTRENAENLPDGFIPDDHLVVYIQWSSQVGGYCFIVPQDSVRELDISVEEGMRWSLTAGLSGPKSDDTSGSKNKKKGDEAL
jgi:uncharacterized membrane protein